MAAVLLGGILVLAAGTATASRGRSGAAALPAIAATAPGERTAYDVRRGDPVRGGARLVADREGFLTRPSDAPPGRLAVNYLRLRSAAFGLDSGDLATLELTRRYTSESGATHLQWQQTFRGVPAFDNGLRASVSADGRLINIGGTLRPDLAVRSTEPRLTAGEALRALGRGRSHRATLVLFGDADRIRLAWRLLVRIDSQHVYDAVVDATTGETLYRRNLVLSATGLAFDNYPGAPIGGTQVSKVFPETGQDPWVTDPDRLFGHNAHVYSDEEDRIDGDPPDPGPLAGDEIPPSSPGTWDYPHEARPPSSSLQDCPAVPGCSWNNFDATPPNFSWRVNREQAGTQLFYFVNRFHDHLRDAAGIGFDEASGNFEEGDRVHAQVDDGAATDSGTFDDFPDCNHINNASVLPLPDGQPLLMQVYLWSSACQTSSQIHDVNAADEAMVIYHEYAHGLTNRLVTDAAGFSGLTGPQSAAMDEGSADWYALDLLNAQGLEPDSPAPGELQAGRYPNVQLRTQAFDCPVGAPASSCPGSPTAGPGGYTYGDFGKVLGGPEVHADGEIWVETLWDLRAALIAAHGAAGGIDRVRALVTDGLRLAPANPTFLDMRNAILQADVNRGFGDRDRIWAVFAARGMGVGASTTGDFDTTPDQDFSVPRQPAPPPGPSAPSDVIDPIVSGFSLADRRFHVGLDRTPLAAQQRRRLPIGSRFRFTLSERATVTIEIERTRPGRRVGRTCRRPTRRLRLRPRCKRYERRGALTRRDRRAGRNRVPFSGRIGVRALRPGLYRATISAVDAAGNESRRRRASFRIVPR